MNDSLYLPAETVDGVGPVTAGRLAEAGIDTVADLLADYLQRIESAEHLDGVEDTLFEACLLMLVDGIDKDHADGLVREGVTLRRLDDLRAETVLEKLDAQRAAGRFKHVPPLEEVRRWQLRAARIAVCPVLSLQLTDLSGGQGGFAVETARGTVPATPRGTVILSAIPGWEMVVKVHHGDRFLDLVDLRGMAGPYGALRRGYSVAGDAPVFALAEDGLPVPPGGRVEIVRTALSDLAEGTLLRARGGDGETFLMIDGWRLATRSSLVTVITPGDGLSDLVAGARYAWRGGQLERLE